MEHITYINKERQDFHKRLVLCPYMASESSMRSSGKISCNNMAHFGEMKTNR